MAALMVLSVDRRVGKTALCAGIARCLTGSGKKVGYARPVFPGDSNEDAAFMKKVLAAPEGAELMSPAVTPDSLAGYFEAAVKQVSAGKDTIIVEGAIGDSNLADAYSRLAKALGARVILVEAYEHPHPERYQLQGADLMGVVVNKVPARRLPQVREAEKARLTAAGVSFLGAVPEDRVLLAVTVADLSAGIGAKILNSSEKSGRLVENFMLGALSVDSGLVYYNRKPAKAAVLRADRPDMQLAALETDTACLVLTGSNKPPIHSVTFKAENKGIPILQTKKTVPEVVADIEDTLERARFGREEKIPKLNDLLQQSIDLRGICGSLGRAK